jgi:hypothetical protein
MSMSLRSFHLFFIAASVLLSAWIGVWGVGRYRASGSLEDLALGVVCIGLGIILAVYGLKARKKLRALEPEE